ncbi:MAG TPA: type II toxin-antitoxin system VapB family antitoxin [Rhizomicrobium sp.]|nr:type II toxin-antitoxin system VapB family antitoxin [Rhizomicrobium sp.]
MGALNIKDAAVAEKARKLARLTGKTITDAVSAALDESLRVATHKSAIDNEARERRVDEILARIRAKIPPDAPSWEEVMADMYDENGLPK